jgi:transposase
MLTMDQIHHIRELFYQQGKSLAAIADELNIDWRTVKKYVDKEDFSPTPPATDSQKSHSSKLDPFKPLINEWLEADLKAPRKQRHTATRVYDRLKKETDGFDASYRLVADYIASRKKELHLTRKEGYIPLIHRPGEAQADFGTADFYENEKLNKDGKYLVLSFPYSNGGFLQMNYGENLECLLEGLQTMFEHIGGVPTEIWFDNTKTIVTDIIKGGGRTLTERFVRFAEHYRFKPVFMNPNSGNEKGNVENKVGYLRRNELVPVPRYESLPEGNRKLLTACEEDMQREHYENEGTTIAELFEADQKALLPLPSVRFDTAGYQTVQTNKYGMFTLCKGAHTYSVSPGHASCAVNLKITSRDVIVMDDGGKEITRHRRLYGGHQQESMNWVPYLKYIARKPRSLRNSGIYDMMPPAMQKYLDTCDTTDRGKILRVLSELTDRSGFSAAMVTVNLAVEHGATDPDSLQSLYRRTFADVPIIAPLENDIAVSGAKVIPINTDLSIYDRSLQRGGAANG